MEHEQEYNDNYNLVMTKIQNWFVANLDNNEDCQAYLRKRGLDIISQLNYGLGYAPSAEAYQLVLSNRGRGTITLLGDKGTLQECGILKEDGVPALIRRITFPILNLDGDIISFAGRDYGSRPESQRAKYLNLSNSAQFEKGSTLFNIHRVLHSDYVVITEGYFDCIISDASGVPTVCSMGAGLWAKQAILLNRLGIHNIVLCGDGDIAGYIAMAMSANFIAEQSLGSSIRYILLPGGKDPDDIVIQQGKDVWANMVSAANELTELNANKLLKLIFEKPDNKYLKNSIGVLYKFAKTFASKSWVNFISEEYNYKSTGKSIINYKNIRKMYDNGI